MSNAIALSEAIAESIIWGSDQSDRFQTLARWRGEPSPKVVSAGGHEAAKWIKLPPGWSTSRFSRPGWPEKDSFVYLIDVKSRIIVGMDRRLLLVDRLAWVPSVVGSRAILGSDLLDRGESFARSVSPLTARRLLRRHLRRHDGCV